MKILTLFLTYGSSLSDWDKTGTIDREINIYSKYLNYFEKIYFITYGSDDQKFSEKLPKNIIVLPKKIKTNNLIYSLSIPFLYKNELKESTWLKTNQMLGSWSAVLAKLFFRKKLNIRTGYTESLSYIGKNFIKKTSIKIIELIAYKTATTATVTSAFQKDYIAKKYKPKNIFVISNGIDTEIFKPLENKISLEKNKLLFVGRLHPEKNLLNLLEAIKNLKNIKLKIIGQGPLEKKILELREKYNLDLEIIPSVPNNELPKIYNSANIYVQPSMYEGNPKTILEAMSCGLSVIATDIPGIRDIIQHKENGYLCQKDPKSIQNSILYLLEDSDLRTAISRKARIFIEENYSMKKTVNQELDLYEEFIL